ncbi:MAG: acyltransferase [Bacteroidetes bacterium]|nr:acyltransferase [Bacteroidota bacterium]
MKNSKHIYFNGLNGLRFFAALAVIVTHIELIKGSFGLKNHWNSPLFFNLGGLGVYFFFVLSGFLITYLLLAEKEKFGKISIKQFYIRRVFRIWPLYYFVLLLGFFVLPQFEAFKIGYLESSFEQHFYPNLILYIFILPNLAFSFYPAVPNIGQSWSIGVEEQFYIVWPIIIAKSKSILKTLLIIIVVLVFVKVVVLLLGSHFKDTAWYKPLKSFVAMSKFECMSIGGLGAYFLYTNHSILKLVYNPIFFAISVVCSILLIYFTPEKLQDGVHLAYSVLFLQIILFVAKKSESTYFDNRVFNYLGKISYGMYMYHLMVIPLCIYMYVKYGKVNSSLIENCVVYGTVILLTILVSGISYHFFEQKFIKLKSNYSPIKSGETN